MNVNLNQRTVLVLNRSWQAIDTTHPAMAYCQMSTDVATGLDILGREHMLPVKWSEWLDLPIREGDASVGLSGGRRVRVPTVIVLARYARVPMRRPSLSRRTVWQRDKGICQYTGRKLAPGEANLDHVLPQSRGGGNTWENLVLSSREVNTRKANKTPQEAGLRLLRAPVAPKAMPATVFLRNHHGIPEWEIFGIPTGQPDEE